MPEFAYRLPVHGESYHDSMKLEIETLPTDRNGNPKVDFIGYEPTTPITTTRTTTTIAPVTTAFTESAVTTTKSKSVSKVTGQ